MQMEKATGAYSNPLTYGNNSLMSGYISKKNYEKMKNSSGIGVANLGKGKVIGFTENVAFRAFWFGTNKLLMNAVFYGPLLSRTAGGRLHFIHVIFTPMLFVSTWGFNLLIIEANKNNISFLSFLHFTCVSGTT